MFSNYLVLARYSHPAEGWNIEEYKKNIYFVVSQRVCKATGPVPVAMAKGTFVRSESRADGGANVEAGNWLRTLDCTRQGEEEESLEPTLGADGNIYFEDV